MEPGPVPKIPDRNDSEQSLHELRELWTRPSRRSVLAHLAKTSMKEKKSEILEELRMLNKKFNQVIQS